MTFDGDFVALQADRYFTARQPASRVRREGREYPNMNNPYQKYYVGCDVSDEETALCIMNGDGDIVHEAMVPSEPKDIAAYFHSTLLKFERVGRCRLALQSR